MVREKLEYPAGTGKNKCKNREDLNVMKKHDAVKRILAGISALAMISSLSVYGGVTPFSVSQVSAASEDRNEENNWGLSSEWKVSPQGLVAYSGNGSDYAVKCYHDGEWRSITFFDFPILPYTVNKKAEVTLCEPSFNANGDAVILKYTLKNGSNEVVKDRLALYADTYVCGNDRSKNETRYDGAVLVMTDDRSIEYDGGTGLSFVVFSNILKFKPAKCGDVGKDPSTYEPPTSEGYDSAFLAYGPEVELQPGEEIVYAIESSMTEPENIDHFLEENGGGISHTHSYGQKTDSQVEWEYNDDKTQITSATFDVECECEKTGKIIVHDDGTFTVSDGFDESLIDANETKLTSETVIDTKHTKKVHYTAQYKVGEQIYSFNKDVTIINHLYNSKNNSSVEWGYTQDYKQIASATLVVPCAECGEENAEVTVFLDGGQPECKNVNVDASQNYISSKIVTNCLQSETTEYVAHFLVEGQEYTYRKEVTDKNAAGAHDLTDVAASTDCTKGPLFAYKHCNTCNENFKVVDGELVKLTADDIKPNDSHDFSVVSNVPYSSKSCTEPVKYQYKCADCGKLEGNPNHLSDSNQDGETMMGHLYNKVDYKWIPAEDGSGFEKCIMTYYCTREGCSDKQKDHSVSYEVFLKDSGADESYGYFEENTEKSKYTCENEGMAYYTAYFNAENVTGHSSTATDSVWHATIAHNMTYHAAVAPTCDEDGNVKYYECSNERCGNKYKDYAGSVKLDDVKIEALGHDNVGVLDKKATCTEDGHEAYSYCANETTAEEALKNAEVIPAKGHKPAEDPEITYVWNKEDMTKSYALVKCGGCEEELLYKINMDSSTQNTDVKPTCTKNGYGSFDAVFEYSEENDGVLASDEYKTVEGKITTSIPKLDKHDFDENNECTMCHRKVTELTLTTNDEKVRDNKTYVGFVSVASELPEGFTTVEHGYIYMNGKDNSIEALESLGTDPAQIAEAVAAGTVKKKSGTNMKVNGYIRDTGFGATVRPYLIAKDEDGKEYTVYGEVSHNEFSEPELVFERGTNLEKDGKDYVKYTLSIADLNREAYQIVELGYYYDNSENNEDKSAAEVMAYAEANDKIKKTEHAGTEVANGYLRDTGYGVSVVGFIKIKSVDAEREEIILYSDKGFAEYHDNFGAAADPS